MNAFIDSIRFLLVYYGVHGRNLTNAIKATNRNIDKAITEDKVKLGGKVARLAKEIHGYERGKKTLDIHGTTEDIMNTRREFKERILMLWKLKLYGGWGFMIDLEKYITKNKVIIKTDELQDVYPRVRELVSYIMNDAHFNTVVEFKSRESAYDILCYIANKFLRQATEETVTETEFCTNCLKFTTPMLCVACGLRVNNKNSLDNQSGSSTDESRVWKRAKIAHIMFIFENLGKMYYASKYLMEATRYTTAHVDLIIASQSKMVTNALIAGNMSRATLLGVLENLKHIENHVTLNGLCGNGTPKQITVASQVLIYKNLVKSIYDGGLGITMPDYNLVLVQRGVLEHRRLSERITTKKRPTIATIAQDFIKSIKKQDKKNKMRPWRTWFKK